jgi:hypothetical protein
VLHRRVLVDVAGHTERRELADFGGVGDRAAEDDDRRLVVAELLEVAHQLHALPLREPQVESDEIDALAVAAHQAEQLGASTNREGLMASLGQRRTETVPDEGRVVGYDNGLHRLQGCRARHASCIGVTRRAR